MESAGILIFVFVSLFFHFITLWIACGTAVKLDRLAKGSRFITNALAEQIIKLGAEKERVKKKVLDELMNEELQ